VLSSQETTTRSRDLGFLGFATANYHLRLGNSFFFRPGLGAGWFQATRQVPAAASGTKIESSLSGPAGKLDLGFVYYASGNFNLWAGVDFVGRTGNEKAADGTKTRFTDLDAGFSVGLGYSF